MPQPTSEHDLLHHDRLTAPDARPERWLLVLHGLFGSGRNWTSVARRIVEARPQWGAILVDLREHGQSTHVPGPRTLDAAADDLARLIDALAISAPAVMGHSLGGKVALAYAGRAESLRSVFIIDSTPARVAGEGLAGGMLELLGELPNRYTSREQAIATMESRGVSRPMAQWMAMNLVPDDGGLRWRFDLAAIGQLYDDFKSRELWEVLQTRSSIEYHFLCATQSQVVTASTRQRLRSIGEHVHVHAIEGGHWLNVDNPAAVARLVAENLA